MNIIITYKRHGQQVAHPAGSGFDDCVEKWWIVGFFLKMFQITA